MLCQIQVNCLAHFRSQCFQSIDLAAYVSGTRISSQALAANGSSECDVHVNDIDFFASSCGYAVNEEPLVIFLSQFADSLNRVNHTSGCFVEYHSDHLNSRVSLDHFFYLSEIRFFCPWEFAVYERNVVLFDDLQQSFSKYAVSDQQNLFSFVEDGGQNGFVGRSTRTGNNHGSVCIVCLEQLVDLSCCTCKQFFEFCSSVADIIVS